MSSRTLFLSQNNEVSLNGDVVVLAIAQIENSYAAEFIDPNIRGITTRQSKINFNFDARVDLVNACHVLWRNENYIFGGSKEKTTLDKIFFVSC